MIGADASPFARQTLICGWDQERLTRARVMVAGVGALGNASAVDLALTGIGRLLLVDFDHIETSNLSRTIDSGSLTGFGRRKRLKTVNSAAFTPIPSASEITTIAVNPGRFSKLLTAN